MAQLIDQAPQPARGRAAPSRTSAERDAQRARDYHRQQVTTYWYMIGLLAISLFGAIGVSLAAAFTR